MKQKIFHPKYFAGGLILGVMLFPFGTFALLSGYYVWQAWAGCFGGLILMSLYAYSIKVQETGQNES